MRGLGSDAQGDAGAITIWLLGLCVMLLFVGGLSLDLWRVLSDRRALAGMADSAAVAAATAVDESRFRSEGIVALDPDMGRRRALESLAGQSDAGGVDDVDARVTPQQATVVLEGSVPLTLLRILLPGEDPAVRLRVQSVAAPRAG